MDTNQQNNTANNYQINSFSGGMNSDTAYDQISNTQYLFGKNIRITNNALIFGDIDSNTTENVISPVPSGKKVKVSISAQYDKKIQFDRILAVASIENKGAIVIKDTDKKWHIFRAILEGEDIQITKIFSSNVLTNKNRFSAILNNEVTLNESIRNNKTKDILKLYIADGVHPIMSIDIMNDDYNESISSVQQLISNYYFPKEKIKFTGFVAGKLKTQQVQYTYRFYKSYGICSRLAPLTNKFNIIDASRSKEIGNAHNTVTSRGLKLKIDYDKNFSTVFDHVQIFRISYITKGQPAQIYLISDATIEKNSTSFNFQDLGSTELAQYTIDEFAALYGTTIIPEAIDTNNNYLFAANVKDFSNLRINYSDYNPRSYQFSPNQIKFNKACEYYIDTDYNEAQKETISNVYSLNIPEAACINKYVDMGRASEALDDWNDQKLDKQGYLGGTGPNISWRFVTCQMDLDISNDTIDAPVQDATATNLDLYYIKYNINTRKYEFKEVTKQNAANATYAKDKETVNSYFNDHGVHFSEVISYKNTITSSILRSLRRDEIYRYGIVFYTDKGTKSDVLWIADIRTPTIEEFPITKNDSYLKARPLGIRFEVKKPQIIINSSKQNIIGYQIVRCEKSPEFSKNLLQVALSRPLSQQRFGDRYWESPYYPNIYLSTQFFNIVYGWYPNDKSFGCGQEGTVLGTPRYTFKDNGAHWLDGSATNLRNLTLYQAFSPEITFSEVDAKMMINSSTSKLSPLYYAFSYRDITGFAIWRLSNIKWEDPMPSDDPDTSDSSPFWYDLDVLATQQEQIIFRQGTFALCKARLNFDKEAKKYQTFVIKPYNAIFNPIYGESQLSRDRTLKKTALDILDVGSVQLPQWWSGFSDIQRSDNGDVTSATKQYLSYTSVVGKFNYLNWACNGMYNLPVGENEAESRYGDSNGRGLKVFSDANDSSDRYSEPSGRYGWIGPGPRCLLLNTQEIAKNEYGGYDHILACQPRFDTISQHSQIVYKQIGLGTVIANVYHTPVQYAGLLNEQRQYDTYYGFGNYVNYDTSDVSEIKSQCVFDGEIYIVPAEFVNLTKAYDFNDHYETLCSGQVVYYMPLESTINTYFDYGMNYRNTHSTNLSTEPCVIDGIVTQARPMNQYNQIYSNNAASNDVYAAQMLDESIYTYKHRIYYSQLKTNGERIDNWLLYKPADFLDADTKYGEITNLLSTSNNIYFWQTNAFGKLSVNERSLITDNNGSTIQLGQGGVLQRTDYISTKYGMRKEDFCSTEINNTVYWIDMDNKAIVSYYNNAVNNYSEVTNVQNIVNKNISFEDLPTIHYDLQNAELLCKLLKNNQQLIFNNKQNVATSIYTRDYENIIPFNNVLYGIKLESDNNIFITKYNYLSEYDNLLSPTAISFIVNSSPSQTKVFDVQKIVTPKREYDLQFIEKYLNNKQYTLTTDICGTAENVALEGMTDREGNICYPIPRFENNRFGNRTRGKWMKVDIVDKEPNKDYCISHIITKFRQSYS